MDPPSLDRTNMAISARNGERHTRALPAMHISKARFTNPENPRMDLCGLNLCGSRVRAAVDTLGNKLSKSGLKDFTRKSLHTTPDLLGSPGHPFEAADGMDNG